MTVSYLVVLEKLLAGRGALLEQVCECEHAQFFRQLSPGHMVFNKNTTQFHEHLAV